MFYRVTTMKGKPEMNDQCYALLDENMAILEAMSDIEKFGYLKQMKKKVVIACYESQETCEALLP